MEREKIKWNDTKNRKKWSIERETRRKWNWSFMKMFEKEIHTFTLTSHSPEKKNENKYSRI